VTGRKLLWNNISGGGGGEHRQKEYAGAIGTFINRKEKENPLKKRKKAQGRGVYQREAGGCLSKVKLGTVINQRKGEREGIWVIKRY